MEKKFFGAALGAPEEGSLEQYRSEVYDWGLLGLVSGRRPYEQILGLVNYVNPKHIDLSNY